LTFNLSRRSSICQVFTSVETVNTPHADECLNDSIPEQTVVCETEGKPSSCRRGQCPYRYRSRLGASRCRRSHFTCDGPPRIPGRWPPRSERGTAYPVTVLPLLGLAPVPAGKSVSSLGLKEGMVEHETNETNHSFLLVPLGCCALDAVTILS
jgi:hypothetical protein